MVGFRFKLDSLLRC